MPALLRDAWALWRSDWNLLTAVAGVFLFLPMLALLLLLPPVPQLAAGIDPVAGGAAVIAWQEAVKDWVLRYGVWQLGAQLLALYGQFSLVALYLAGSRPEVRHALTTALTRIPVFILALLALAFPLMIASMVAALIPLLIPVLIALAVIVAARTAVVGPTIIAERPIGPIVAIRRSLKMTRRHGFVMAAAVITVIVGIEVAGVPLSILDRWLSAVAPNPLLLLAVDGLIAMVTALGGIAMALIQVAAYRRLSST